MKRTIPLADLLAWSKAEARKHRLKAKWLKQERRNDALADREHLLARMHSLVFQSAFRQLAHCELCRQMAEKSK